MRVAVYLASLALALNSMGGQLPSVVTFGSIKGVVTDASGSAVSDAKVYDEPMGSVRIGKDHFVLTDQQGRFFLPDVPAGKTMVIATKTEAGYPDARFAVYTGDETLPIVEVSSGQVAVGVVVKLASKGALLRGKIMDASSKLPVAKSRIMLSRVDHPGWSIETDPESDGSFEFVLPPKPLHLSVTAQGYRAWNYEDSGFSKQRGPLTLAPETNETIDVYLERSTEGKSE